MLPDLIAYDAGLRPLWVLKLFLWLQELLQILWCMTQHFCARLRIPSLLPLVLSSLVSRLWLSFFLWLACTSSLLHTNSQVWVWSNSCLVQLYQWLSNSHYGWVALFIVLWTGDSAVCLLCVLLVLSLRESLVLVVLTAAACCCQALLDAYLVSWWVANCLVTWSWPVFMVAGFEEKKKIKIKIKILDMIV